MRLFPFVFFLLPFAGAAQSLDEQGLQVTEIPTADHLGIWQCRPRTDIDDVSEVNFLVFTPEGTTQRRQPGEQTEWQDATAWVVVEGRLRWSDPATNEYFEGVYSDQRMEVRLYGDAEYSRVIGDARCQRAVDAPVAQAPPTPKFPNRPQRTGPMGRAPRESQLMVAPEYPREALARGLEGRVVVCYTVNDEGIPEDAIVTESSDSIFDQATLDAIVASRYLPRRTARRRTNDDACRLFRYRLD